MTLIIANNTKVWNWFFFVMLLLCWICSMLILNVLIDLIVSFCSVSFDILWMKSWNKQTLIFYLGFDAVWTMEISIELELIVYFQFKQLSEIYVLFLKSCKCWWNVLYLLFDVERLVNRFVPSVWEHDVSQISSGTKTLLFYTVWLSYRLSI